MRSFPRFALLLCAFLCGRPFVVAGQSAILLRDIGQGTGSPQAESSYPRNLIALDGKVLFTATAGGAGEEPWVSDGTPLGTQMLADICPGPCSSNPDLLGSAGHFVLWLATEEPGGKPRLWSSDGTRPGTYRLADELINVSSSDYQTRLQAAGDGAVYFQGCTQARGCEPWRSDGTPEGTRMIADLAPGEASSNLGGFTMAGGKLFLYSQDYQGSSLWVSNGTAAGTLSLGRFKFLHHLTAAGNRLYFFGGTGDDQDLWVSDGTAAGTRQVSQFHAASPFGNLDAFFPKAVGDRIYFVAAEDGQGQEIWRSDGTTTVRLTDFAETYALANAPAGQPLEEAGGGRLVFELPKDGRSGSPLYLYASAGSPATTFPLMPLCGDYCDSMGLAKTGSRVVFRVEGSGQNQGSIWSTDGTTAGTVRLTAPGVNVATRPLSGGAAVAYFWTYNPNGIDLWRTDGTATGTKPIAWSVGSLPFSAPLPEVVSAGAKVFFNAETTDTGRELWITDGTRAGSHIVLDVRRNEADSDPHELVAQGDRIFFDACGIWQSSGTPESTSPVAGNEDFCDPNFYTRTKGLTVLGNLLFFELGSPYNPQLWRTDGTAGGTLQLTPDGVTVSGATVFQSRLFFVAQRTGQRAEIWSSDGTAAGTGKAFEFPEPLDVESELSTEGTVLFFGARRANGSGPDLWMSDGTTAGTRRIKQSIDLYDRPRAVTRLNGSIFFFLDPGVSVLMKTDGTEAGTVPVPLSGDSSLYEPQNLTLFQGSLYFLAIDVSAGAALVRSDGTTGGTAVVHRFAGIGSGRDGFTPLAVFQNQLYFVADDGEHGFELWKSDGTTAGTVMVRDGLPGPLGSNPAWLTPAGDRLFFTAGESVHGVELWETDGTEAGTRLAQDISPLGGSSGPQQLTVAGDHLFFSADDGLAGRELWALPLGADATVCQPSDTNLCLKGNRFRVEARWQDFAGNNGAGHAVSLTADTGYFWFFDPKNVETLLKVLDGQGVNGHFWVFYGGLSNVEYELTVTDTQSGLSRRYFNPPGQFASVGDTQGFGPLGAYKSKSVAPPSPPLLVSERLDAAAATGVCVPGPDRLCLNDGRFSVQAAWKDFAGHTGAGTAVGITGDTGYFWFFDPANVEVILKVLDGRPVNGKFWVYYGALSNVEYTLTVTDTMTGKVKTYQNPPGRFASAGDSAAF